MAATIKSDATLRAIKPPASGRVFYRDQRVPSLQLQVTSRGTMTWYVVAKFQGKAARFNLGHYGQASGAGVSLEDAREAAQVHAEKLRAGIHPHREQEDAEVRRKDTFAAVRDRFLRVYAAKKKPRTHVAYKQALESKRLQAWEQKPVYEITRKDVIDLIDQIAEQDEKLIMANRQLAYLRKFFNWCAEKGILAESESVPTDRVKPPLAKEQPRTRWLSVAEIKLLWEVAGGQDYPFGPFVQLMLATGQRRDELVNMQWADVDGDRWTQSDNKGGRTHIVPLHPLAKGILADLPRFKNATLLFSTTTTTPVSGFSKYKKRLDKAIAAAKVQHKLEGVFDAHWTLHDLRRTMTTHLRQMRIDRDVCSRLLNHAPKGITAKVYDQWEMLDEKTEAMNAWGSFLERTINGNPDNVVKLRTSK